MGQDWRIYRRGHTKTDAGMRDVPINNLVRPILEQAIADMRWNKEGLIFYDHYKKGVISTSQVNCFYRRICEKAGIDPVRRGETLNLEEYAKLSEALMHKG